MPRTYDFTKGQGWGFKLHASTWKPLPERWTGHLWWRKKLPSQVQITVHCSPWPNPGDLVIYNVESGKRHTRVVDTDRCSNVSDMFTLTLEAV